MTNGIDLLRLQHPAHPDHDRRGWLRRLAREQRPLGQDQMHAGGLNAVDAADGAGELALQRAQVVDVLHERGGAERIRLVEDFVADAAALGQAALGELHAQPRDLVLGYEDDAAFIAQLKGDALAFEILDDARRVLEAEVGKQGRHLRRGDAHDDEGEEADQRGRHRDHRRQPRSPQTLQKVYQTLQNRLPRRFGTQIHWAIIAYGMVSIWLTKVKRWRRSLGMKKNRPRMARPICFKSADFAGSASTGGIAECGWCAARQDRADRSRTARRGTRRRSRCNGCKLPRATAIRREPRQRLRPFGE